MGNYRQHITFAATLGVAYGWATFVLAGIHWLYGSVAALLTTLGGLLPDLDSDTGVELKGFTGILGVLVAVAVWQEMEGVEPAPAFEFQLWAVVGAYVLVRHGLRRALSRMARHRGSAIASPPAWSGGPRPHDDVPGRAEDRAAVGRAEDVVGRHHQRHRLDRQPAGDGQGSPSPAPSDGP